MYKPSKLEKYRQVAFRMEVFIRQGHGRDPEAQETKKELKARWVELAPEDKAHITMSQKGGE